MYTKPKNKQNSRGSISNPNTSKTALPKQYIEINHCN